MSEAVLSPKDRIIVAVDTHDLGLATEMVDELTPHVGAFKLGLEFWMNLIGKLMRGPRDLAHADLDASRRLLEAIGPQLMTDVKFYDILNTMIGATRGAAALESALFTVHASTGVPGVSAAVENAGSSKVLAVTLLTSMDGEDCKDVYGTRDTRRVVERLVNVSARANTYGIVCAPGDVMFAKTIVADYMGVWNPEFVCPGIRPAWAATNDQNADRAMPPGEAVRAGVSRMVIGRPVTKPPSRFASRAEAADAIAEEIANALR